MPRSKRTQGDSDSLQTLGRAGDRGAVEHYADPAYYTKTYAARRHDVDYYVRLARLSGGPVLEYGIGNGRIAISIARAGVAIHGVDLSEPMLNSLAQRLRSEPKPVRVRVSYTHGDMRRVRLRRRFPLVLATFNTVLHLYDRADFEAFLECARRHLAPGGRLVFDFSVPQPRDLCRDPNRSYSAPRVRHPTTGQLVRYAERFEYDPIRQLLLTWMDFVPEDRGQRWTVALTHRQFFPAEMAALLHYRGFTECVWSADFSDQPPDAHVDSMVVSCRARAGGTGRPARGHGPRTPVARRRKSP